MGVTVQNIQFSSKFNRSKNPNLSKADVTCPNILHAQNNNLTDSNYGVLIAKNAISFNGKSIPLTFSDKLSVILHNMQCGNLLVISNDIKASAEKLCTLSSHFEEAAKSVIFLKQEGIATPVAFYKDSYGDPLLMNIGDESLRIDRIGLESELVKPNMGALMDEGDKISDTSARENVIEFKPLSQLKKIPRVEFPDAITFDFSDATVNPVTQLNASLFNQVLATLTESTQVPPLAHLPQVAQAEAKVAQIASKGVRRIGFADVGGQDTAIKEIKKEIISPIRYPFAYANSDEINHGILLVGPPGTGKSLIAEAVANECNCYYKKLGPTELTSMYHGKTEENWREVFQELRDNAPSILFVDEIDGLIAARGSDAGHTYNDKIVTELLKLMSDVEKDGVPVFVLGATNKKEVLDSAMVRGGRFARVIDIPYPDVEGYKSVLKIHTRNKPLSSDVNLSELAEKCKNSKIAPANATEIVRLARENALLRTGISKKMEDGTLVPEDMNQLLITSSDFDSAYAKHIKEHNANPDGKIMGFHAFLPGLVSPVQDDLQLVARV